MTANKHLSIVFITNNWAPFKAGVVSSINAYKEELIKEGHTVSLITLDFQGTYKKFEEGVIRIYCPIKFTYRGIPFAIPLSAYTQIASVIKTLQPDIIHCHHPFLLGKAGLKAAKAQSIPCIFTYHSLYDKYTHYVPLLPQHLLKKLVSKQVRAYCQRVDGIITPGSETERLLQEAAIETPRVLLPSPLQRVYVEHDRMQSMQRIPFGISNKPFHLMTCSRFVKEKNIPFLLDCFSRLDQHTFRFTLAGFGSELDALQKYAYGNLGLSSDVVHFVVHPESTLLKELYHTSDLFLFSSLADTQGLVLAEAMACGLPVVALDGPGQEDIVESGENGFLVKNTSEMQTAIEHIARDRELHQRMRGNALETAKRYAPEALTEKLVAFYRSFL